MPCLAYLVVTCSFAASTPLATAVCVTYRQVTHKSVNECIVLHLSHCNPGSTWAGLGMNVPRAANQLSSLLALLVMLPPRLLQDTRTNTRTANMMVDFAQPTQQHGVSWPWPATQGWM